MKPRAPQQDPAAFTAVPPGFGQPVPAVQLAQTQPVRNLVPTSEPEPPPESPHITLWVAMPLVTTTPNRVAAIDTVDNVLVTTVTLNPSEFAKARGIEYFDSPANTKIWMPAGAQSGGPAEGSMASFFTTAPSPGLVVRTPSYVEGYPVKVVSGSLWRGNYDAVEPFGELMEVDPLTSLPTGATRSLDDVGLTRRPFRMDDLEGEALVWCLDSAGEGRFLKVAVNGPASVTPSTGDDMAPSSTLMERGAQFAAIARSVALLGHGGGAPSRLFSTDLVTMVTSTVALSSDFGEWRRGMAYGPLGRFYSTWRTTVGLTVCTLARHDEAGVVEATFTPEVADLGQVFPETWINGDRPYIWVEALVTSPANALVLIKVDTGTMTEVARVELQAPVSLVFPEFITDGVFSPEGPA